MDGATTPLKEKLARLLREAAEVSVALDRAEGTIVGVPHYSIIEARAHELGRGLSREIQARQVDAILVAAHTGRQPKPCITLRADSMPSAMPRPAPISASGDSRTMPALPSMARA